MAPLEVTNDLMASDSINVAGQCVGVDPEAGFNLEIRESRSEGRQVSQRRSNVFPREGFANRTEGPGVASALLQGSKLQAYRVLNSHSPSYR